MDTNKTAQPQKEKARYSGHETRLAHWVKDGLTIKFRMNDGQITKARIMSYDRFTVTIQPSGTKGRDKQEIIFKHAIASMTPDAIAA